MILFTYVGISLMFQHITSFLLTEVDSIRILAELPFIMIGCVIFLFGYPKATNPLSG